VPSERHRQLKTKRQVQSLPAIVALIVAVAQTLLFEAAGSCAEPVRVQTQRMFVPRLHPELWPAGDWVPVEPQKLDLLLKTAGIVSATPERFSFESASYEATFNSQTNLLEHGTATLTRVRENAGLTLFEPYSLTLTDPRWIDEKTAAGPGQKAVLGTDLTGLKQLVTPAGVQQLNFSWSLAGRRRLTGIDFEVEVPKATVSSFRLTVPPGWQVSSSVGVVRAEAVESKSLTAESDSSQLTTWQIDLGQANRCRIRLHEPVANTATQLQGIASYRLNSRMSLRSEGIEQLFEFTFDSASSLGEELTVAIPPDLIVSSIEDHLGRAYSWRDTGPQPDKWHVLRVQLTAGSGTDPSRVVLRGRQAVPPPGSNYVNVRVEPPRPASAVLLGGYESPFRLVIESPYQIATYASAGLRQTATSVDEERHELVFEQYSSQASVDLQIQNSGWQSSRKLSVREYSLLNVAATPQQLNTVLELTSQSQGIYVSSWLVPLEWEVTAVSLAADAALSESNSEKLSWNVSKSPDQQQRLVIDFADGLPVRKPLTLRVVAQRADNSRESRIHVPVILPEIARSVSLTFGVVGCRDPHGLQIASENYRRQTDADSLTDPTRNDLMATFSEIPQAVWTTDYWAMTDKIRSAMLLLPDDIGNGVPTTPTEPDAGDRETGSVSTADSRQSGDASEPEVSMSPSAVMTEQDHATPVSVQELVQPVIVSVEFDSQLSPGSVSRDLHRFTWRFHYSSEPLPFRFQLPAASELLAVTWRNQNVAPVQEGEEWFVPLPLVDAGDELSVEYTLPSQDVYLRETYRCRIPKMDVTVIQFDWRVRLRNQYSVVSFASELTPNEEERQGNWLSWCFGPLARNDSSRVFNPVGVDSWIRFLRGRDLEAAKRTPAGKPSWLMYSASASGLPESLTVHICDHSRLHALSWFVLTISALIGVLLRAIAAPHRSRFALVWLSGCVASVALVPGAYAELVGAAALGSILATLVPRSFVRPVRNTMPDAVKVGMASTITRRIVTGSMLFWAMCLAASAVAQPTESESGAAIDVLVPYSESPFQAEANVKFVYIRNVDWKRLSTAITERADSPPQLLLTESRWTLNVTESGRAEIIASIVVALHDDKANELEIPVPARFLTGQAQCSINDIPVGVLPTADGDGLRIPLPSFLAEATQPGPGETPRPPPLPEPLDLWREYKVKLHLRPLTERSSDVSRISLPIPAIPDSRVTLSFYRQPAAVFVGQSSEPTPVTPQEVTDIALGPKGELTVSWRHLDAGVSLTMGQPSKLPTVEMRSSIEIHPNWMDRRTQSKYLVTDQAVRYIAWKLPEFCQVDLEQFRIRNLVDKSVRREGRQTILTCEFDPPMTSTFDFDFQWRQMQLERAATSAIVWAVPIAPGEKTSTPLTVTSHLAGISPEAGFQLSRDLQTPAVTSSADRNKFVEQWPENVRPRIPLMAFRVSEGMVLSPEIVPSQAQRTTRLSQVARIQPFGIQWKVSAEVDTTVVPVFTHEFRLDETFRVDSVTVLEDDVDRLSHWEHENGRLVLHLRDRRSGVQNITITGQRKFKADGSVKVPHIEPVFGESAESTLLIYRSQQLQVEVEGPEAINDEPAPVHAVQNSEVFVGRFRLSPGQNTGLQIQQVPVDPAVWLVADVTSDSADEVLVAVSVHLHAISRRIIQIELPEWAASGSITEPPTISSPGAEVVIASDQKSMEIRLPRPIPQRTSLTMKVKFSPQDGTSFQLPPLMVKNIEQQHAVITLAQEMDEWDLLPGDLPGEALLTELSDFGPRSDNGSEEFVMWTEATRISQQTPHPGSEKLPALVLHTVQPGIRRSGVSTTRILFQTDEPHVELAWPQKIQLISIRIDGRVENVLPPVGGVLRLPLVGQRSVRDIEILWSLQRDPSAMKIQRRTTPLPALIDIEPVQAFVVATPSRRTRLISTESSVKQDRQDAIHLSNRWTDFVRRRHSTSTRLDVARQIAESLTMGPIHPTSQFEQRSDDFFSNATMDLLLAVNDGGKTKNESNTIVQRVAGTQIEFWVVDVQVDRILGSILIAIVVLPVFILFLGLQTGDRIARRPELCWLVLGLIWWLCLRGSGAGFLLAIMSCMWIAGTHMLRRRFSPAIPGNL